ncbi:hypothetical protein CHLNCDRAFT_51950 [Chlorella variabilis]|uniref:Trafficking protein particle complex subunit n=1 Tax=Chlorella variabilis TaxID=554065 RepID=E1ZCM4_CHLVA|nr:hypothetical protein CHLNCDRAFT_51950 [Chlorella variabilis]EFN56460.1 hypothetical protein CHLNCDRAFT_51950 [Chlorella variabilis]|eukprot:XP_005848562.1 hypothetical protein CHLNCDRAFT_51950 [Chlorella variabilis]
MPAMYSLWIVGRNGGLLYSRDFWQLPPIEFNDKLRLASSWFGMCGISAQLSPMPDSSGIQLMQADTFDLHSFHTLTGTTFMLLTEPHTPDAAELLRTTVYELYCDYVLKNPFHEMDQVVKSELFDHNLVALFAAVNRRWGVGLAQ